VYEGLSPQAFFWCHKYKYLMIKILYINQYHAKNYRRFSSTYANIPHPIRGIALPANAPTVVAPFIPPMVILGNFLITPMDLH
jgi:hypothetical protein